MPALDELFTQVENYPTMTMDYLLVSLSASGSPTASKLPSCDPLALLAARGMTRSRAQIASPLASSLCCLVWNKADLGPPSFPPVLEDRQGYASYTRPHGRESAPRR